MYLEKISQEEIILRLLRSKRFVTLYELKWLNIAQYNARIFWLRGKWHIIEQKRQIMEIWGFKRRVSTYWYKWKR